MKRRNRNQRRKSTARRSLRTTGPRAFGSRQRVIRASGVDYFAECGLNFSAGSLTAENGFLINLGPPSQPTPVGTATGIEGTYVPVCPGLLSVRSQRIGDNYYEYMVHRVRLNYRPLVKSVNTTMTFTDNNASGTLYPFPDWRGVIAWSADPFYNGTTFTFNEALAQSNSKFVMLSEPWTFGFTPEPKWLYQPSVANDYELAASLGDLRTMFAGNILTLLSANTHVPVTRTGTDASALAVPLGDIWIEWDISFRYPADPDLTGPALSMRERLALMQSISSVRSTAAKRVVKEEKKDDSSKKSLMTVAESKKGFFF